jgi:hypothetical protein
LILRGEVVYLWSLACDGDLEIGAGWNAALRKRFVMLREYRPAKATARVA